VLQNYGILIDVAMVSRGAGRIKSRFERRRYRQRLPRPAAALNESIESIGDESIEDEPIESIEEVLKRFYAEVARMHRVLDDLGAPGGHTPPGTPEVEEDSIRTLSDGYESSEAWEPAGGWDRDAAEAGPSGTVREALNELRQQEHHASHAARGDTRSRAVKRRADFAPVAGEHPKSTRHVRGYTSENRRSARLAGKRKADLAPLPEEHPKDRRFVRGRADDHRRSERLAGKRKADLAALTEDHGTQDRRQMRRSGHEN
jgi:hypothetical protein